MNPFDLIKFFGSLRHTDTSNWDQVVVLKPEDLAKYKLELAKLNEVRDQIAVLEKKIRIMIAQVELQDSEWWDYLHKTYGLPRARSYRIKEDGRILMKPKSNPHE